MKAALALLQRLAGWAAVAGAGVALATALLITVSVLLRAVLNQPIPGDVEITQMAIALAISLCLPYCQSRGANILVDFFTQKLPPRATRGLDAAGSLLLSVVYGLLAWRTSVGALSVREAGETTMIIALPLWWVYAWLAPGLGLASLIALLQGLGAAQPPAQSQTREKVQGTA